MTLQHLRNVVQQACDEIPQEPIDHLIRIMPGECQNVFVNIKLQLIVRF